MSFEKKYSSDNNIDNNDNNNNDNDNINTNKKLID